MVRSLSVVFVALAVVASCGPSGVPAGEERGPCYPNGTCNAGLTCLSSLCVSTATDAGGLDAGGDVGADAVVTTGCGGTFGPGVLVFDGVSRALGPAVTGDELELFFFDEVGEVGLATRARTSDPFTTYRMVPELSALCGGSTVTGVDVSEDGLRAYVACSVVGLVQAHRSSRDAGAAFVQDAVVATTASTPAVVQDELELYDQMLGQVTRATRSSTSSPFSAPVPLTGLAGVGDTSSPDLSPDGLTLYVSLTTPPGSSTRQLVSFTRASTSAEFSASTQSFLGIESSTNSGSPEVTASCRSMYFAQLDGSAVRVYVSHR